MEQVKYRNMPLQVVLLIVTFGVYAVYWFFQTTNELKMLTESEAAAPTLWTILLFIPIANIYVYYKHSELYANVCSEKLNKWILFLLWVCFSPAIWFLVQRDLNKLSLKTE